MIARVHLLIFVLLSTVSFSQLNSARFPGKRSQLPSPDGHYVLINVDNDQEPYHSVIFLKQRSTGVKRKIIDCGRSAAVIWAPDSRHFALNDYAGSDYTNTYIVSVHESVPWLDIQEQIATQIRNLPGGHHEYFGVVRWLDNQRVVVQHWGYGESRPGAFCECYVYTLNRSVKKCTSQPQSRDPDRCQQLVP